MLKTMIHPLNKFRIYHEARKHVFQEMNNNKISPARAAEIMDYLKGALLSGQSLEDMKVILMQAVEKFPELASIKTKIQNDENEQLYRQITLLVDNMIQQGNLELADQLMGEVASLQKQSDEAAEKLLDKYAEQSETSSSDTN